MADAHLLFEAAPGSAALVFGEVGPSPVILALGSAAVFSYPASASPLREGASPIASSAALARHDDSMAIDRVPAMGSSLVLAAAAAPVGITYDNAVNRAPHQWARGNWQGTRRSGASAACAYARPVAEQADCRVPLLSGVRADMRATGAWRDASRACRTSLRAPQAAGTFVGARAHVPYESLSPDTRPALLAPWWAGHPAPARAAAPWQDLGRTQRPTPASSWQECRPAFTAVVARHHRAAPAGVAPRAPWQTARVPPPGKSTGPVDPPDPGERWVASAHLLFLDALAAAGVHLVFGRPRVAYLSARCSIPILRAYLVANDISLHRVSGNLSLTALNLRLQIDADSYCWGWQATLPGVWLDEVQPIGGDPAEFEAKINGVTFRLLAEKVTRDRRFANHRIILSGRGIAAELGAPSAPVRARQNAGARTAQQCMAEVLTENGAPNGWAIDWQITDWLVPAGAWGHTGTYIEACTRIAEAAGAYVQADRSARILHVQHRYPTPPWDWHLITPDYSIPAAATIHETAEWVEWPDYNAQYITGEAAGILAHIQRAGTAADHHAPMVVDPLTTHVDAARQRGRATLGATGRRRILRLETPILPGVGIYPVGSMVRFADGADSAIGIVRSLQIAADFPSVRQTIEVECNA